MSGTVNVVIAGLGGQGVLKASDILADAAFAAGMDVKKSELHGMSQRGGSVSSDVRFGESVGSPMIPRGEADYLLVLSADQVDVNRHVLVSGGKLIEPSAIDESALESKRSLNMALLGALSKLLDIPEDSWRRALEENLPADSLESNLKAFEAGRSAGR